MLLEPSRMARFCSMIALSFSTLFRVDAIGANPAGPCVSDVLLFQYPLSGRCYWSRAQIEFSGGLAPCFSTLFRVDAIGALSQVDNGRNRYRFSTLFRVDAIGALQKHTAGFVHPGFSTLFRVDAIGAGT